MKKLLLLFLALISHLFISSLPGGKQFKKLLTHICIEKQIESELNISSIQDLIEASKKKLLAHFALQFNPKEPLPFISCVDPAIFDIAKSHSNLELFECTLANPSFNFHTLIDSKSNNLFHVCAKAGTNKFLKLLFNYCRERNINLHRLIHMKNEYGRTPLELATLYSRTKSLSLLLSYSAQHAQSDLLMHFAAAANTRGETKRNKIIELLHDYDETLITKVNTHKKGAEEIAKIYNFASTEQLIKKYKIPLMQQLHEENFLYFHLLPSEIFETSVKLAFDPQSFVCLQSAQSQPA